MDSKQKYRELCRVEKSIPLSSRDWWLDIVAGENKWNVAIVEKNNNIIASLPYIITHQLGMRIIRMPRFTPSLGVWFQYPADQKYNTRLSYEKRLCDDLISQLPRFDRFYQRFHYRFSNWLPFFWQNFEQTTRYIYLIEDLTDLDKVFADFRDNIRREIRKAEKQVEIYYEEGVDELFSLIEKTYQRQNKRLTYSHHFLEELNRACQQQKCSQIILARDSRKNVHAGIYLVWDEDCAYYLFGGSDPELRTSGAASLVMWEAIKFASKVTRKFNFAGSMIESIEKYFRAFGGIQMPYFAIFKNRHIFKLLQASIKLK